MHNIFLNTIPLTRQEPAGDLVLCIIAQHDGRAEDLERQAQQQPLRTHKGTQHGLTGATEGIAFGPTINTATFHSRSRCLLRATVCYPQCASLCYL